METQTLKIADIKTDAGTQVRVTIDEPTVTEYAEAMQTGAEFPPPTVFYDGSNYFMADGFHRIRAAERVGKTEIAAEVREGSRADALIFALGANLTNGLRRTNADKRRCVEIALQEFADWSDRRIAETCGISNTFVGKIRSEVSTVDTCPPRVEGAADESHICPERGDDEGEVRTGRDGKAYKKLNSSAAREAAVKEDEDPKIRSWSTALTTIQSLIRHITAEGGPESILQETPPEDRHDWASQLRKIIGVFQVWAQDLDGQDSAAATLPGDSQAPIELDGASPGDRIAAPGSQQDSAGPIAAQNAREAAPQVVSDAEFFSQHRRKRNKDSQSKASAAPQDQGCEHLTSACSDE